LHHPIQVKDIGSEDGKVSMCSSITVSTWELISSTEACKITQRFCLLMNKCFLNVFDDTRNIISRGIQYLSSWMNTSIGYATPLQGKTTINNFPYMQNRWDYPQLKLYINMAIQDLCKFATHKITKRN
jgi:hypothetical protein